MSKPPSHALNELSNTELKELVLGLLGEVAALKQIVAEQKQLIGEQRDEIARLKGLKGRPDIKASKPSGMERASQKKASWGGDGKRRGRGKKTLSRVMVEDRTIKAGGPVGPPFRGYEDFANPELGPPPAAD